MRLIVLNLFTLLLIGCIPVLDEQERPEPSGESMVEVPFDIRYSLLLRSTITPEETSVKDMNLYAYCDGKLASYRYFEGEEPLSLKLLYGQVYNLYALANMGQVEAPLEEDVFRQECVYEICEIWDLDHSLPMAWEHDGFILDSYSPRVGVELERQVAKVVLSIDKAALGGLEVRAVSLHQSSSAVWPFKYPEGSYISDPYQTYMGDSASDSDIIRLNNGGQVHFYALENCQGCLLEGNTDPKNKIPDMIGDRAELCTYLQLQCSFVDGGFYQGNVLYRIYLGQDAYSDFNVRANSVLNVTLSLTDDGLNDLSWRVEPDISINQDCVDGWMSEGLHAMTDLYVGEKFIYSLKLSDEMLTHLDGDIENARIAVLDRANQTFFDFGNIIAEATHEGWTSYDIEMVCRNPGRGTLCLLDANNREVAYLDDFYIQKPSLSVSLSRYSPFNQILTLCNDALTLKINDSFQDLYIYLTDKEGRNLNSSISPGFDFSIFSLESPGLDSDEVVYSAIDYKVSGGVENDDGPFRIISLKCNNSGEDDGQNSSLLDFMTNGSRGVIDFTEENYKISSDVEFRLGYLPITLTLVDNGWAGYHDCQISMKVDNISKLPLDVKCWQFNTGNDDYNALTRNEAVQQYGVKYTREAYNCISGYSALGADPIYASFDSFTTKPNNELSVYPLPELSTNSIYMVLAYDYYGQEALSHRVDVAFSDGSSVDNVSVVDNLSDGSTTYEIVYGNDPDADGWNDRGAWLYSCGQLLQKAGTEFDAYPTLDTYDLERLHNGTSGKIYVNYDSTEKSFTAYVSTTALNGLTITAEYVIKAQGYVQTTPNGTWGKKVDNYCHTVVTKAIENHVLTTTPVIIDSGGLQEAMNTIYASTYIDSYNKVGSSNSYQHSAHPTSIDVEIELSLSGNFQGSVIPVVFTKPSQTTFYHAQEDVTYNVPITSSLPLHKIAIVDNL